MKEIVPVTQQNVEINAKTLDNAIKSIFYIDEIKKHIIEKEKPVQIFSKIGDSEDEAKLIEIDDEFEKIIYGMKKGAHRELWLDGFSRIADDIIKENEKKER